MKRFLSFLLASVVCVVATSSMMAQDAKLTTNQWKRGIAIVGQNAALDGRYGHPENEFPEGYTLDDLNKVYKSQKWKEVYEELKQQEDRVGDMQKLKDIAKRHTQPNGVERKLKEYIAAHPESNKEVTTAAAPAKTETTEAAPADNSRSLDTVPATTDSIAVINTTAGGEEKQSGNMLSMIIDLLVFLVAVGALYLAWATKKENAELKKELDYKIDKLTSQFEKFSKNITTDLNRVTYKVNKRRTSEGDATISFNDDGSPVAEAVEEPRELKRYYLTKPDTNDFFIRATENIEVGNSIYELYTSDGLTGTFRVIDNADVHHFALLMPTENLIRACTGNAIQISNGKTRIVTDREGTARFENGRWHVAVKAIVHYEA